MVDVAHGAASDDGDQQQRDDADYEGNCGVAFGWLSGQDPHQRHTKPLAPLAAVVARTATLRPAVRPHLHFSQATIISLPSFPINLDQFCY